LDCRQRSGPYDELASYRRGRSPSGGLADCEFKELSLVPFSTVIPTAVTNNLCGVCEASGSITKYIECKSLDSGYAALYVCKNCFAVYNSTAETQQMDVLEWQKRWAEDPDFYNVPTGDEFAEMVSQRDPIFEFIQGDLDRKFSGTYLEIGAGSGLMAASALKFFDDVYAFDHVQERLKLTRKQVDKRRYHVISDREIEGVQADMILIWHALEHLLSPGRVFKLCGRCLKDTGLVLIQVPILSFEHVYPGHYYFYNEIALTKMAELAGLKIEKFYYDHAMNAMTAAFSKAP
jgi:SAM-dependent methyltransferase